MSKKPHKPIDLPHEIHQALERNKAAMKKFKSLTFDRQQEYVDYVGSAVKKETKRQRIKKIIDDLKSNIL